MTTVQQPTTIRLPLSHKPITLIDAADVERVEAAGPWSFAMCGGKVYAQRSVRQPDGSYKTERLHTFLTGWPLVDHINGDGLDNRRANLRPATASQNNANKKISRRNTSGYKGVAWHAASGRWRAYLGVNGKQKSLGYFADPAEAGRAYDTAALAHYGEFAVLNFPKESSK